MTPPQPVPRATGSTEDVAARECDALFAGLAVTPAVRAQAMQLIRADSLARRDLVRAFPGRFAEQTDMLRRRNAAIRLVLTDDSLLAPYDANAADLEGRRARGEAIHPAACDAPAEA